VRKVSFIIVLCMFFFHIANAAENADTVCVFNSMAGERRLFLASDGRVLLLVERHSTIFYRYDRAVLKGYNSWRRLRII